MGEELASQLSNAFKFKFSFSKVIELTRFLCQLVSNAEVYYPLLALSRQHKIHHQPVLGVNAVNILISVMQISPKSSQCCKQFYSDLVFLFCSYSIQETSSNQHFIDR